MAARFARHALRLSARAYATSVTGYGREVEGFVGAVGNTPLVRHIFHFPPISHQTNQDFLRSD